MRPQPLSTCIGISLVSAALAAGIVIIAWHSPTAAVLTGMLTGGAALIRVLEQAPTPSPVPTPVAPASDAVPVPAAPAPSPKENP